MTYITGGKTPLTLVNIGPIHLHGRKVVLVVSIIVLVFASITRGHSFLLDMIS